MRQRLTAAALVLLAGACTEHVDETARLSVSGVYLDASGRSGTIALRAPDGEHLTGELTLAGEPAIPLTGSYRGETGSVSFASDDGAYEFEGGLGSYAGGTGVVPAGDAAFALFVGADPSEVTAYCGPAVCTAPDGCASQGTVQVAVRGSSALMTFLLFGTDIVVGPGSASATAVNVQVGDTFSTIDLNVRGELDAGAVTGTWTDALAGTSGTWDGTTTPCAGTSSAPSSR
jgi:hypothetical protein